MAPRLLGEGLSLRLRSILGRVLVTNDTGNWHDVMLSKMKLCLEQSQLCVY